MNYIGNVQSQANAEVFAVASGALASGDTVIVNTDGTVSIVAETILSQQLGTAVVFESATILYAAIVYDANAQKVVIAYQDSGNSDRGTAVVGTVSGTSISFGTPVVFETGDTLYISAAYDTNAQKVVICYRDEGNTDRGTAIVATVSGTSISYGSPVIFETDRTSDIAAVYDSENQKVVVAYLDRGDFKGKCAVGTVSGTSISFGTIEEFESSSQSPYNLKTTAIYDSNSKKIVIAYRANSNSFQATAIVGTVSGTNISFGAKVTFGTMDSSTRRHLSAAYHTNRNKVVITYHDANNSFYGTFAVGTVSGTSISFSTPVVFEASESRYETAAAYDANAQKVVAAYPDYGNNNYGTSIVFSPESVSTNLTSENFIGFSDAAYANTQTATIEVGSAINNGQSSLTIGQQYFVQTNGTIGTTAADPSVIAGTAISATEIIVKG